MIFRVNIFSSLLMLLLNFSCTKDVGRIKVGPEIHKYPEDIAEIILTKCATSGCHNTRSNAAAADLNLDTWDNMFRGSGSGAVIIPYNPDYSPLMFYINSYPEFGTVQLSPKMPLNQPALTNEEVKKFYNWIKAGAPSAAGEIKFSEPDTKKFYAANQGCDVIAVFDAKTMLASRYIPVGETRGIEAPHMTRVSPDNQHWYVSFIGGGYFQKYRVSDNMMIGKVNLGVGSWNTFVITDDSKTAYVIDWSSPGKIAAVDLAAMTRTLHLGFNFPHGSALNKNNDKLYVTAQYSNYIYKFSLSDFDNPKKIILDGTEWPVESPVVDPHEIIFSPDGSKYFVTCQTTNDVRVMNSADDALLSVIPVGKFPQEMAISKAQPYLFVTCMDDVSDGPEKRSSVYIINYNTNAIVKSLHAGFQSHGVVVDDENKRVYIGNRNFSTDGPPPHHQGLCSGRNGYISAIDMNTLNLVPNFKAEVSIDPYGLGITN